MDTASSTDADKVKTYIADATRTKQNKKLRLPSLQTRAKKPSTLGLLLPFLEDHNCVPPE
jgi:hypothetical protein